MIFLNIVFQNLIILNSFFPILRASKSPSNNVIDLNDILSMNYMPETLFVLDNVEDEAKLFNGSLHGREMVDDNLSDGSIDNALGTMDFHRNMMNQYLCRSYVAGQILTEMNLTKITKRMAILSEDKKLPFKGKLDVKNDLLFDEGSSSYKNWLAKSTTLEDIYRHYNQDKDKKNVDIDRNTELHIEEADLDGDFKVTEDKEFPDSFDIHVTNNHAAGYNPKKTVRMGGHQPPTGGYREGGGGYSSGGGGYYYPESGTHVAGYGQEGYDEHIHVGEQEQYHYSSPPKYQVHHHGLSGGGYDKAQDLADIFEIALTALAFLSFGMFIVHLFMSISMVINNTTATTTTTASSLFLAMNLNPTATADAYYSGESGGYSSSGEYYFTGASGTGHTNSDSEEGNYKDTFKFRLKRDSSQPTNNNPVLNELARMVLVSIDAALVVNSDKGVCLRKALCETNKYSRSLKGMAKIILPVWSLGMSWLSGRLIKSVSPVTLMIDSLKASILGIGMANCKIIYQSCDLKQQKSMKKKKK